MLHRILGVILTLSGIGLLLFAIKNEYAILNVVSAFIIAIGAGTFALEDGPSYSPPQKKKKKGYNENEHFVYWNLFLKNRRR